ncbi:hypothetical protein KPA93_24975 [Burkholderia cenocepacia]|uniref:hypothetical protein n=1 Tax=Burkholderia cenocepacia TaxID=95486 RepID=UPI0028592912|nr:hypothetical protein [Burkholderia cenocepacia]MDR8026478.1 hypothetical protein [Burkholderia cenocepacia]MDR8043732.1 hypothetical protein [Burkholderia cenocepacia]
MNFEDGTQRAAEPPMWALISDLESLADHARSKDTELLIKALSLHAKIIAAALQTAGGERG